METTIMGATLLPYLVFQKLLRDDLMFVSFQAAMLGDNPAGPCLIGREGSRAFPRKSHPKP